ncbi:MAG: DUF4097 family beta strand repeat-containing protein [Marinifilaceae bacterium]
MRRKISSKVLVLLLVGTLGYASGLKAQKLYDQQKASFEGVKILNVEGSFCDVLIEAESQKQIDFRGEIRGESRSGGRDLKIHHSREGEVLRVWVDSPNGFYRNLDGKLQFKVPSDLQLDVRNSSGNIMVFGIRNAGMKLKATSGDIELKDIHANLEFETTSGDFELMELTGDIEGKSTSGDQTFRKVKGSLYTRATSGELSFYDIDGEIESKTSSGNVDFEGIHGNMKNESTSGNIHVRYCQGALSMRATSGNIRGEGIELKQNSRFRTTSGNISMDFENDLESLGFDLEASSGDLYVGNRHGEKEILFRRGDILVRGESSSGNQRYK